MEGDRDDPRGVDGLQQGFDAAGQQPSGTVDQVCETCPWVEVGAIDEATGEPLGNLPYKVFDYRTKVEVASGTLDGGGLSVRHMVPGTSGELMVVLGTNAAIAEALARMDNPDVRQQLMANAVPEWRGFPAGLSREDFNARHWARAQNGDFVDADRGYVEGAWSGARGLADLIYHGTFGEGLEGWALSQYNRRQQDAWEQYQLLTGAEAADKGESFGGGLDQGLTFGFSDEIAAGLGSLLDSRSYTQLVEAQRSIVEQRRISNPGTFVVGEVAGAIPTIFIPVGGASAAAARTGTAAVVSTGARTGTAFGAVSGFGHDTGGVLDRIDGTALGAATGGIGGAILAGAGVLIARGVARMRIWAVARMNRGTGPLRLPARPVGPHEGDLIGREHGLQSRQWGPFEQTVQGRHGDDATKYLWTIDERGINLALEKTPWPTPRRNIVHTNLSSRASIGGEAWFGPGNTVTINAGSGRFGDGAGITQSQWTASVRYWQELGYDVIAIPFGSR